MLGNDLDDQSSECWLMSIDTADSNVNRNITPGEWHSISVRV